MAALQTTAGANDSNEALDIEIISIMLDYKSRTASEIAEVLKERSSRHSRSSIKARAITLAHRGWFKRIKRQNETFYQLQKEFTLNIAPHTAMTSIATKPDAMENTTPTPVNQDSFENKTTTEPTAVVQGTTNQYKIDVSEGLDVCIWKVMSDYEIYTMDDLHTLLSSVGVNKSTLAGYMVKLSTEQQWFDVGMKPSSLAYMYRLKKGIPMPAITKPYRPHNKAKTPPTDMNSDNATDLATDNQSSKPATNTDPGLIASTSHIDESSSQPNTPSELPTEQTAAHNTETQVQQSAAPLPAFFESFARIKGVEFNSFELGLLKNYLYGHLNASWPGVTATRSVDARTNFGGFGNQTPVWNGARPIIPTPDAEALQKYYQCKNNLRDGGLLDIKHTISFKGVELTYDEAQELLQKLFTFGSI